jgi:uncharacterized membrane protein
MRSKMSVGGHPIHPMLVALPIGLIVWTLVADLIYAVSGRVLWYDIAYWSGVAGVITGLAAALPGVGDYALLPLSPQVRRLATAHMALNVLAIALLAIAAFLMADYRAASGGAWIAVLALHAIVNALIAASGWLGGELVYRHRLAVEEAPTRGQDAEAPVEWPEHAQTRP